MPQIAIKPNDKHITAYYRALEVSARQKMLHEGAVAPHFANLLQAIARPHGLSLQQQYQIERKGQYPIRVDGALLDMYTLRHGLWEAKDGDDDLRREVAVKLKKGYPADNILFQSPERAILYRNGREVFDDDISDARRLVEGLKLFFAYEPPQYDQWQEAVAKFSIEVPELAENLRKLIEEERRMNRPFVGAFEDFGALVRQALNPNISTAAVDDMLIQHLLTERLFRRVFDNPDFGRRNVIAAEIEKVINALTSRKFSRNEFLGRLDRFYVAIEKTAATLDHYSDKQSFLNTVYEQFFQGYNVKAADTHGIVYTPQPIVDFMVRSVDDILRREFGKPDGLASDGVAILDPFVGTGNFILRVMRRMPKSRLQAKYRGELFCNEIMLLPYYIAGMNIEHEYYELTGQYEPFEGISLVDTFQLAEMDAPQQMLAFMTPENTERVERQRKSDIFVIIGNPPYNIGQANENDNNKNRKYPVLDRWVSETYARDSAATNKNALSDVYVKAFAWAARRIGEEGIVAFVSNNSFIDGIALDGMRKHLAEAFDDLYILDLGGNVRRNPKLSGTTHNVFGIQVGVSINLLIRRRDSNRPGRVHYARVDEFWRRGEKYDWLEEVGDRRGVEWRTMQPDKRNTWLTDGMHDEFDGFLSMGSKEAKAGEAEAIFVIYGRGVGTSRDAWAYNFTKHELAKNMNDTIEFYNSHVERRRRIPGRIDVDSFASYDDTRISWSVFLKQDLQRGQLAEFLPDKIRQSLYRPFVTQYLFFDRVMNNEVSQFPIIFPTTGSETENVVICVPGAGGRTPYWAFAAGEIANLSLTSVDANQCFPFYTYNEDGSGRTENITDWALEQFRAAYGPAADISKWDIFHYIYALLHHPVYRETYAANLRRELPRIPFVRDFDAYVRAGRRLAELHVHYEAQTPYPLRFIENPDEPLNWRVEKMRLSKDRSEIVYNDFLTLAGVPAAAFEYRLGNRSALEWVLDQYRVSTDRRSGIVNDPNREDDPQYIVRLVGQVIAVSLETVEIVNGLPAWEVIE